MTPNTHDFMQTANAQVWAQEFIKRAKGDPAFALDEGNMIGWFANAIMRGHDDGFAKGQTSTPTRAATDALNESPSSTTATPAITHVPGMKYGYAIVGTVRGAFMLVDTTDENAPIATFVSEDEAKRFAQAFAFDGPWALPSSRALSDGVSLIAAERKRQASEDDAKLTDGQLVDSALLMLDFARSGNVDFTGEPLGCAEKLAVRHREDVPRLLTIAGAFIAAEIDRLTGAPK
jgi:hypothetical protein